MSLNREQERVVKEGEGYSLVLSGPGSGKTKTLVHRTAYLIKKGVSPENILLLTFTKKAAREMLERVEEVSHLPADKLMGGTFHHVGNYFLRKYADKLSLNENYTIIDESDSLEIINFLLKEKGEDLRAKGPKKVISFSVNSGKSLEETLESHFPHLLEYLPLIENIEKEYSKEKSRKGFLDYDDLLKKWLDLLMIPSVKEEIAFQFHYVLVDEYQDTNFLQDQILERISSVHQNLLVVGDDSQSIYSFRAANLENILNFPKKYPQSKLFRLEINYRSTPEIVDLANKIIENNRYKLDKKLISKSGKGPLPQIHSFESYKGQINFLMRRIKSKGDYKNTAILFRAHYQAANLEIRLAKEGIPYLVRGGVRFFEQTHIKDLSSFLRIIINYKDSVSWKRILEKQEGVGPVSSSKIIERIEEYSSLKEVIDKKEELFYGLSKKASEKIKEIINLLESSYKEKPSKIIKTFISDWYGDYLLKNYQNPEERMEDLSQIISLSRQYESLEEMLSDFTLSEEFKKEMKDEKNCLTLTTIHQAKGLEWENVFIIALNEGDFPHIKAKEEEALEEERRLFYVAATRCKRNLFLLSYSLSPRGSYLYPSRFLEEAGMEEDLEEEIELIEEDEFN